MPPPNPHLFFLIRQECSEGTGARRHSPPTPVERWRKERVIPKGFGVKEGKSVTGRGPASENNNSVHQVDLYDALKHA